MLLHVAHFLSTIEGCGVALRKGDGDIMPPAGRERFTQLVSGPEEALDLAEAALLIAQEEQPSLDVSQEL